MSADDPPRAARAHPLGSRRLVGAAVLLLATLLLSWFALAGRAELDARHAHALRDAMVLEVGQVRPRTAAPDDVPWARASLPDNWDGQRPGYSGYVWYRMALPDAAALRHDAALYLPAVAMNAEVWLNGQRLGGIGRMDPPLSRHFYTPLLFDLPPALLQTRANRIDVLVAGHPGYRCGLAPAWVGARAALYDAWRRRQLWQGDGTLVTVVFNLAIGLYMLLLWARERSQVAFAWFGIAIVVWGLRNLNYVVTDPPLPDLLFAELCVSGAAWFTALFAVFVEHFCREEDTGQRERPGMRHFALGYAALATLFFVSSPDYGSARAGFAAFALVGIGLTGWSQMRLVRLAWRQPRTELLAVALGALAYLLLLINDFRIGIDTSSLGEVFIRQYAALPLFVALATTLSRRHVLALQQSRELSATLQARVESQRAELARSFEALKEAERETARAQERSRMMGELHDGLGLHLVAALRQVESDSTPRETVAETLRDCLDDLRVAIDSLDETERDPVALLASLRYRLAPRFAAMGTTLRWEVDAQLPPLSLDAEAALQVLRIMQEALTNALKHSGGRDICLRVARDGREICLSVSDDGPGFDPATVRHGQGLSQMRLRAQRVGARIAFGGPPGANAVRLWLPVPGGS